MKWLTWRSCGHGMIPFVPPELFSSPSVVHSDPVQTNNTAEHHHRPTFWPSWVGVARGRHIYLQLAVEPFRSPLPNSLPNDIMLADWLSTFWHQSALANLPSRPALRSAAPTVLLCYQSSNCLLSAVEPSRSALSNSGTSCLITLCWLIHCGPFGTNQLLVNFLVEQHCILRLQSSCCATNDKTVYCRQSSLPGRRCPTLAQLARRHRAGWFAVDLSASTEPLSVPAVLPRCCTVTVAQLCYCVSGPIGGSSCLGRYKYYRLID